MIFTKGFEYKGFIYGWHKRELYRLPSVSGLRTYPTKKLNAIKIGNAAGYRLKKDKRTVQQCLDMTRIFIQPIIIEAHEATEVPF